MVVGRAVMHTGFANVADMIPDQVYGAKVFNSRRVDVHWSRRACPEAIHPASKHQVTSERFNRTIGTACILLYPLFICHVKILFLVQSLTIGSAKKFNAEIRSDIRSDARRCSRTLFRSGEIPMSSGTALTFQYDVPDRVSDKTSTASHGVMTTNSKADSFRNAPSMSCAGSTRASRAATPLLSTSSTMSAPADPRVEPEDDVVSASRSLCGLVYAHGVCGGSHRCGCLAREFSF